MNVAVDVRMTVDQFVAQGIGHVSEIERPLFLAQLRIEHHVQEQVAQLLLDALHIVIGDGVGQFVGLLNGVAAQRIESLLAVPGTFAAQRVHHLQKTGRGRQTFVFFH